MTLGLPEFTLLKSRKPSVIFLLLSVTPLVLALPALAQSKYMGSATCASSNCHGSVSPRSGSNVLQNEYTTWYRNGAHAQAWRILSKKESKTIGNHLGIANPEKAELCLKCHATYLPNKSSRGPRYRLADGVGCESCHGAAQKYLKPHTARDSSHKNNVSLGMIDLVSLTKRAELCMSCHLGTDNQTVNHRLIGAGHPRLTYELDTYGILQPNHWEVDDDYVKRKGAYNSAKAWLVGQISRSSEMLAMMASGKRAKFGALPELTLYYCYNCHHSLKEDQWKKRSYGGRPGELNLNVSSLLIVREGLKAVSKGLSKELDSKIAGLHTAHRNGKEKQLVAELKALIDQKIAPAVAKATFSKAVVKQLMKNIAKFGASQKNYWPYEVAEQCAMALSATSAVVDPNGKIYQKGIDAVYETLSQEEEFDPAAFRKASRAFLGKL